MARRLHRISLHGAALAIALAGSAFALSADDPSRRRPRLQPGRRATLLHFAAIKLRLFQALLRGVTTGIHLVSPVTSLEATQSKAQGFRLLLTVDEALEAMLAAI